MALKSNAVGPSQVTALELANNAVTTNKIISANVSNAKLTNSSIILNGGGGVVFSQPNLSLGASSQGSINTDSSIYNSPSLGLNTITDSHIPDNTIQNSKIMGISVPENLFVKSGRVMATSITNIQNIGYVDIPSFETTSTSITTVATLPLGSLNFQQPLFWALFPISNSTGGIYINSWDIGGTITAFIYVDSTRHTISKYFNIVTTGWIGSTICGVNNNDAISGTLTLSMAKYSNHPGSVNSRVGMANMRLAIFKMFG